VAVARYIHLLDEWSRAGIIMRKSIIHPIENSMRIPPYHEVVHDIRLALGLAPGDLYFAGLDPLCSKLISSPLYCQPPVSSSPTTKFVIAQPLMLMAVEPLRSCP